MFGSIDSHSRVSKNNSVNFEIVPEAFINEALFT